jgi:hypothetical protein
MSEVLVAGLYLFSVYEDFTLDLDDASEEKFMAYLSDPESYPY